MKLEVSTSEEFDAAVRLIAHQEAVKTVEEMQKRSNVSTGYLNLGESAKYIHVSRNSLKKLIENGDIKVTWIGGAQRIGKNSLDRYMDNHEV
jgi:excisionase family DNA binding protein